jgi:hypothetical protein
MLSISPVQRVPKFPLVLDPNLIQMDLQAISESIQFIKEIWTERRGYITSILWTK